jgi:putative Mg2+ transporter-C (MgtC) family protein
VLVGIGFYATAILLRLLCAASMMWISRIEGWLPSRQAFAITLNFRKDFVPHEDILRRAALKHYEVASGTISIECRDGTFEWHFAAVELSKTAAAPLPELAAELAKFEGVMSFSLAHTSSSSY